ncbi:MAG: CRISPR-associated protein Cas4 [Actinobacteria bacterium]|nr:CRISPR-associated protein Cas4 [Actinomycetota bacterium]
MDVEPVVPISALEHYAYCPRQCALIHVDGVWQENPHTVKGSFGHQRVDTGRHRKERGVTVLRAIPLWSEKLGLSGRADAVEVVAEGSMKPIEYKIGTPHGRSADIQLCAQALCLEEMMGRPVTAGAVWYANLRRRQEVEIDQSLRSLTLQATTQVRELLVTSRLPPAVDDSRCLQCQLFSHCLPSVSAHPDRARRYIQDSVLTCGC